MRDEAIHDTIRFLRQRAAVYGESQITSDVLMCTTKDWRDAFDAFLVRTQHHLGFVPGTQVDRIARFVRLDDSTQFLANRSTLEAAERQWARKGGE